jgi:hypothetical protein
VQDVSIWNLYALFSYYERTRAKSPLPRRYISSPKANGCTERVCIAVTLWICIQEALGCDLGQALVVLTYVPRGFSQSIQPNAGILP